MCTGDVCFAHIGGIFNIFNIPPQHIHEILPIFTTIIAHTSLDIFASFSLRFTWTVRRLSAAYSSAYG